jgi:bifunctional NMN adenylyltransferase/nudix hydrolase
MKTAVVIGRFQPFHLGHKHMIEQACAIAECVIIVIGDTGCARTAKDPWTVEERIQMIQESMPSLGWRAQIASIQDNPYDDNEWANRVCQAIALRTQKDDEIVLVGHSKDESSYYLNLFPWPLHEVPALRVGDVRPDATNIREALFANNPSGENDAWINMLDPKVYSIILGMDPARVNRLSEEMDAVLVRFAQSASGITRLYGWQPSLAADLFIQSRTHVLLIRRKGKLGKGTYAMPGGFLNKGERLRACAVREGIEETGINVEWPEFKANPFGDFLADAPGRSLGVRTVSHVFGYYIANAETKIVPIAGDDAEWADWVAISDLDKFKPEFFSDHWHLIQQMLNNQP